MPDIRINTLLFPKFKNISPEDTEEGMRTFLKKIPIVERTKVRVDGEVEVVFRNLTLERQETRKLIDLTFFYTGRPCLVGDRTTLKR